MLKAMRLRRVGGEEESHRPKTASGEKVNRVEIPCAGGERLCWERDAKNKGRHNGRPYKMSG